MLFYLTFGGKCCIFVLSQNNFSKGIDMAKYIKQELPDLHKTGEKKAYYRLKTSRNIDFDHFIEHICSHHSGISKGDAIRVLMDATESLAELLAEGCSVAIDELGTFKATVGLEPDKEMDGLDDGAPKRNARSLWLDGVNFQPEKKMVWNMNRHCKLENGGVARISRSPFTKEERLQKALEYIEKVGMIRVKDYMSLVKLARTAATSELRAFSDDPSTGIVAIGRAPARIYVKKAD